MGASSDHPGLNPHPPPAPDPSTDPGLPQQADRSDGVSPNISEVANSRANENNDIFALHPKDAMRLLATAIESLASMTGDVPPIPLHKNEKEITNMREMHSEKVVLVRSHSARSLTRMREETERLDQEQHDGREKSINSNIQVWNTEENSHAQAMTAALANEESSLPNQQSSSKLPHAVIGDDAQPLNTQHGVIARKFYARSPPPISVSDYLMRMHQHVPMSTAVYLAASLYLHRLACEERTVAITPRNAHRLVLAALRVAVKALEDYSYEHGRFAAVGGVKREELARLEVGFCFLTGFELAVGEEMLRDHLTGLRKGIVAQDWSRSPEDLKITLSRLLINDR